MKENIEFFKEYGNKWGWDVKENDEELSFRYNDQMTVLYHLELNRIVIYIPISGNLQRVIEVNANELEFYLEDIIRVAPKILMAGSNVIKKN